MTDLLSASPERGLPPMPRRIAQLPLDGRLFPRPWFAAGENGWGDPARAGAAVQAGTEKRCWICGQPLGRNVVYSLSAQQALTRISVEPPSHLDCAGWTAAAEPCLTAGLPPDIPFDVIVLWTSRSSRMISRGRGYLWDVGEPEACAWYRAGQPATLADASGAIARAARELTPLAETEGRDAMAQLLQSVQDLLRHLPRAEPEVGSAGPAETTPSGSDQNECATILAPSGCQPSQPEQPPTSVRPEA